MKKVFKFLGYILLLLIIAVAGMLTYVKLALPNVGEAPQEMKVSMSPENIERGRYLANSVTVCMDCHSTRDWSKFSGPLVPGTLGKGGDKFDQSIGMPGIYHARNITPAGISRYTDGELFRLITTGVDKENKAIFPIMPYPYYANMDPEDIKCIIAYIRTLPAIENKVPPPVSDFPMNFIINTIPKKATPQKRPPMTDTLAYGAYMVNASACRECHTQVDKGQIIMDLAFQGGREFNFPDGRIIRSANITPDMETGIGAWTEDAFVNRFKSYADTSYVPPTVPSDAFNSIMPWTMYGRMNREDLVAIYKYLRTLKPVAHTVIKFTAPSKATASK